jgi:hypothetical protein
MVLSAESIGMAPVIAPVMDHRFFSCAKKGDNAIFISRSLSITIYATEDNLECRDARPQKI